MKRVVLLGPPASGKGTQGIRLAATLEVPHVSSGHLLRRSMDRGDPHGVRPLVMAGAKVPDEVVQRLIEARLGEGFVLDGYPRTASQAKHLDELLASRGLSLDDVVELVVPEPTLIARMMLRAGAEKRSDDRPEVFMRRLEDYRTDVEELRAYYGDRLEQVDGSGEPEEVFRRLLEAVER